MDLRLKFRLEMKEYNPQTVFLIVRVKERVMGMVVDKVSDVLVIDPAKIRRHRPFSPRSPPSSSTASTRTPKASGHHHQYWGAAQTRRMVHGQPDAPFRASA
jgi:chemotaxis signal transduction protein